MSNDRPKGKLHDIWAYGCNIRWKYREDIIYPFYESLFYCIAYNMNLMIMMTSTTRMTQWIDTSNIRTPTTNAANGSDEDNDNDDCNDNKEKLPCEKGYHPCNLGLKNSIFSVILRMSQLC